MLQRKTQQITLYPILLKQLFRRKNVSNKRSSSTTSEPPTKEEPSPTRHRTQHSGAFANPRTLQSLVLISSPPTLITPTTTMIMLISYKLVFIISLLGYQKFVSFFVVATRLIGFLSIQFALLLIQTRPKWSDRAMVQRVLFDMEIVPLLLILNYCGTPVLENLRGCRSAFKPILFQRLRFLGFYRICLSIQDK